MVNKVNTEQFNELMKEDAVLVDFSATWCGPCKMLAPIMASVSEKLAGKCKVVSVDVDESSDLAEKFGIMAVPTVILFKKGEQVNAFSGFIPEPKVLEFVENKKNEMLVI